MHREQALARLPRMYGEALRLVDSGIDHTRLAERLHVEPEAVGPLIRLAEAKLARLMQQAEESDSRSRRGLGAVDSE